MKKCSVNGCNRSWHTGVYCSKHYMQIYHYGYILPRTKFEPNEMWIEDDICYIQIYDQQNNPKCVAMVDSEDHERIKGYKWHIDDKMMIKHNKIGYLSRFITNTTDPKLDVDHKNHNKLDNRKANLRPCTHAQNGANLLRRYDNKSGYKGVFWDTKSKKWLSSIRHLGKSICLGYWKNKERAAARYNMEAKKLFGEFACLNVIDYK